MNRTNKILDHQGMRLRTEFLVRTITRCPGVGRFRPGPQSLFTVQHSLHLVTVVEDPLTFFRDAMRDAVQVYANTYLADSAPRLTFLRAGRAQAQLSSVSFAADDRYSTRVTWLGPELFEAYCATVDGITGTDLSFNGPVPATLGVAMRCPPPVPEGAVYARPAFVQPLAQESEVGVWRRLTGPSLGARRAMELCAA